MDIIQLKKYCAHLPGATSRIIGPPGNILLYSIGIKQFAYFKLSEPEKWRFSFRTNPERFLELTGVPGIKPARYMARFHWVTIVDVRSVPQGYLKELVTWSYDKAFGALSKPAQARALAR
ncbi:MAG: MmcQ/YjbR family DNA-binding protein [Dokdonella sp.]